MAAGAQARGGGPLARLLLLAILHVNFIALGLEPDFLYPLENVTIAQGRDAIFTCVVNNLGGYRVSGDSAATARVAWIKADTKAILAIHEHVITNNARLSVTHNDYNTWTLNIRGVKREDRGQYMCQVNTDPMKMQTAFLEVVIPPDIIYEETSGDMMVPEGGSAKLVCKARGYPPPKILWRREDGGDIISRGGPQGKTKVTSLEGEIVNLTKVTRSEMGAYLCIAANGVPPSVSKRIMLHVHFHPLVQVPNQLVGAPTGTDVTLQCHVEASPKAINYWTRENGEMIISNDKYQMTEINSSAYSVQMRLVIRNIQRSDLGGYKCISKNSIGDAEGNIRLYAGGIPTSYGLLAVRGETPPAPSRKRSPRPKLVGIPPATNNSSQMELPYRKSREDEDNENDLEETNDVRSSLQGPLREGGPRAEDAGFLGGGGHLHASASPAPRVAPYVAPYAIFLISATVYAAC